MGGRYGPSFDAKTHLKFVEIKDTGKTKVWEIQNSFLGAKIGLIKWFGAWRKYCFFPNEETVFDTKCLNRISEFMDEQMKSRKKKSKS